MEVSFYPKYAIKSYFNFPQLCTEDLFVRTWSTVLPGELEGLWDDVDDSKDVSQSAYDLQCHLVNWRASEMTLMTPKMYPSPHMIYSVT